MSMVWENAHVMLSVRGGGKDRKINNISKSGRPAITGNGAENGAPFSPPELPQWLVAEGYLVFLTKNNGQYAAIGYFPYKSEHFLCLSPSFFHILQVYSEVSWCLPGTLSVSLS